MVLNRCTTLPVPWYFGSIACHQLCHATVMECLSIDTIAQEACPLTTQLLSVTHPQLSQGSEREKKNKEMLERGPGTDES